MEQKCLPPPQYISKLYMSEIFGTFIQTSFLATESPSPIISFLVAKLLYKSKCPSVCMSVCKYVCQV